MWFVRVMPGNDAAVEHTMVAKDSPQEVPVRVLPTLSLVVTSLVSAGAPALAQTQRSLVGAWERFAMKDSTGTPLATLPPAAFTVFTGDGFYLQMAIPTGRPKLAKPLADYTREELLGRFERAEARRGRYTVSGNTLTRTYVSSLNADSEGGPPQVQRFRIEGDVLILTSTSPANKSEVRFRRAK